MRKLALLAVVAFAAACGSSSSPTPSGNVISGTVGTTAFTSASQLAVVTSGDACSIPQALGVTLGVSLAGLNVSDAALTCTSTACPVGTRNLQLVIARVHVAPSGNLNPAPGFVAGTYQYADINNLGSITPDAGGNIAIFTGKVDTVDAACNSNIGGTYAVGPGSTMNVATVSGSVLTGTVSLNLISGSTGQAGGTLTGSFTTDTNCTPSPAPSACVILSEIIKQSGG